MVMWSSGNILQVKVDNIIGRVPDLGGRFVLFFDKKNMSSYLGLLENISIKRVRISSI